MKHVNLWSILTIVWVLFWLWVPTLLWNMLGLDRREWYAFPFIFTCCVITFAGLIHGINSAIDEPSRR